MGGTGGGGLSAPKRPTDAEILAAVQRYGTAPTFLVASTLRGFRVETPWVLRQMKRLERAGLVHRVPHRRAGYVWALGGGEVYS